MRGPAFEPITMKKKQVIQDLLVAVAHGKGYVTGVFETDLKDVSDRFHCFDRLIDPPIGGGERIQRRSNNNDNNRYLLIFSERGERRLSKSTYQWLINWFNTSAFSFYVCKQYDNALLMQVGSMITLPEGVKTTDELVAT